LLHEGDGAGFFWTPETGTNVEKGVCWVFDRTFGLFLLPTPERQHHLQQRPPARGHAGSHGDVSTRARLCVTGHGVILLFGPCPAQLSLQVPPDALEESLEGSASRLGFSALLKLPKKRARKRGRHKSFASVKPLIFD